MGPRAKADLDRGELSIVVRVRNRSPRQLVNLAPCILRAAGQIWRTGLSSEEADIKEEIYVRKCHALVTLTTFTAGREKVR